MLANLVQAIASKAIVSAGIELADAAGEQREHDLEGRRVPLAHGSSHDLGASQAGAGCPSRTNAATTSRPATWPVVARADGPQDASDQSHRADERHGAGRPRGPIAGVLWAVRARGGVAWLRYACRGHADVVAAFLSDSEATRSGHETPGFVPKRQRCGLAADFRFDRIACKEPASTWGPTCASSARRTLSTGHPRGGCRESAVGR
jgi:hypothetical protein